MIIKNNKSFVLIFIFVISTLTFCQNFKNLINPLWLKGIWGLIVFLSLSLLIFRRDKIFKDIIFFCKNNYIFILNITTLFFVTRSFMLIMEEILSSNIIEINLFSNLCIFFLSITLFIIGKLILVQGYERDLEKNSLVYFAYCFFYILINYFLYLFIALLGMDLNIIFSIDSIEWKNIHFGIYTTIFFIVFSINDYND